MEFPPKHHHNGSWLKEGPVLGELIIEKRDERKRGVPHCALVIPTFRNPKMLLQHLERLSKQTYTGFDIIVVYGEEDEFITTPQWASILHIRSREFGSAGAFYAGQRCAFDEGYMKIILADDDCLPESEDLLEKIVSSLGEEDVVKPWMHYPPRKGRHVGWIYHYGGIRRKVLEMSGLTFLPMYRGYDDIELENRIRKAGFEFRMVDASARHQWFKPFLLQDIDTRNSHYIGRGVITAKFLDGAKTEAFKDMFFRILKALCLYVLGRHDLGGAYLNAAHQESGGAFFGGMSLGGQIRKADVTKMNGKAGSSGNDGYIFITPDRRFDIDEKDATAPAAKRTLFAKISGFLACLRFFNRKIVFQDGSNDWDLKSMVFAKCSFIIFGEDMYKVTHERGPIMIALEAIGILAAIPVLFIYAAILCSRGWLELRLRGVSSERYGMKPNPG